MLAARYLRYVAAARAALPLRARLTRLAATRAAKRPGPPTAATLTRAALRLRAARYAALR